MTHRVQQQARDGQWLNLPGEHDTRAQAEVAMRWHERQGKVVRVVEVKG
jgi:hypothetical protein